MSETSILPHEAAHFGAMAGDWWDPDGASKMLHRLNPVRLGYIRDRIDQHWQVDECKLRPLEGRTALDVGCGAGLLAEPLARMGATVTAVDAAPELIAVARAHSAAAGLASGELESAGSTYAGIVGHSQRNGELFIRKHEVHAAERGRQRRVRRSNRQRRDQE